jgi:DinB superfamily
MTNEERQALVEQYKAGYDEVARSLEGFDEESLSAHPVPGKWSAREVVQHLADSEMNSAIRLRKLLTEDDPQIQGYDQEFYATSLRYNERPVAPALDALRGARATTGQLLDRMTDADWSRAGTHSESGRYTAEDWLRIYADHAHNHAAQIQRLRKALNREP